MYYVLTTHKFVLNTKKGSTPLSVQDIRIQWKLKQRISPFFCFQFYVLLCSCLYFMFTNILIQCVVLSQRSLCNLYASIGKDRKGDKGYRNFLGRYIYIYIYMFSYSQVVVQERSNLIWRPNILMDSCQFYEQNSDDELKK